MGSAELTNPFVTVIIPVYNGASTLQQCLRSVLNQEYSHFEIVVVDNNSTDTSRRVIQEVQKNEKKLSYIFEPMQARGAARNAGINAACGEIILMTDQHCFVPSDWIKKLIGPIINEGEFIVMGGERDAVGRFWTKIISQRNKEFRARNRNGLYIKYLDTKNFAARKDVLRQYMFNPQQRNLEDIEFSLRIAGNIRIRYMPEVYVDYFRPISLGRLAKNSFSRGFWARKIYDNYKNKPNLERMPMLESMSLKNQLAFIPWAIYQFIKKPFSEAFFILVADGSWRLGALASQLNKRVESFT